MDKQMVLGMRVMERFIRTGKVGFSGVDYQEAKDGLVVMGQLAEIVDKPTAVAAAEWSEARINRMLEVA